MSITELYRSVGTVNSLATEKKPVAPPTGGKDEFQSLLRQEVQATAPNSAQAVSQKAKLNFSQHAETRIRSRAITWDANLEKRVSNGIDAAQAKGSRETLILADNIAVIANVKSRTVITAMDRTGLKEQIFTNIDSTVLV